MKPGIGDIRQSSERIIVVVGTVLAVALALPFWPSLIIWAALLTFVAKYTHWGPNAFHAAGAAILFLGMASLAAGFLSPDADTWLPPLLAGLVLAFYALLGLRRMLAVRADWIKLMITVIAWSTAILPLGVILGDESARFSCPLLGLLALPAGALIILIARHQYSTVQARDLLERHELKRVLGEDPDPEREKRIREASAQHREHQLRESDGYCSLYYPWYRSWRPDWSSESGYVWWLVPERDSIVFRSTTLFPNFVTERRDEIGMVISSVTRDLIPNLGLAERLEQLIGAFRDGANVQHLRPREQMLAKMPWDHPLLLVLPGSRNERFTYPEGSGIHDSEDLPCVAKRVDVHIRLKDTVVKAVEAISIAHTKAVPMSSTPGNGSPDCNDPLAADTQLARLLLWNSWRILPGVYESLLTCLIEHFREVSVALFMEHDEMLGVSGAARDGYGSRQDFIETLNFRWANQLPHPLEELVEVQVKDLFIDTYVEGTIRSKIFELRKKRKERPLRLQRVITDIRDDIETLFTKGGRDEGERLGTNLIQNLLQAKSRIHKSADDARNVIIKGVGDMREGAPRDAFPDIQNSVVKNHDEFVREADERISAISTKLNEVVRLYGRGGAS